MKHWLALAIGIAVASGCYSPSYRDCEITCVNGACPSGFECRDNVCRAAGATLTCEQVLADSGVGDTNMNMADALVDGSPTADTDGDMVADSTDNCRFIANAEQYNEDGDVFGDVCDPCPAYRMWNNAGVTEDANLDLDGDLVGNGCDPDPTMPGNRIALFVGFNGSTLPPGAVTHINGNALEFFVASGRAIGNASGNGSTRVLFAPVLQNGATTRRTVIARTQIVNIQQTNLGVGGGVIDQIDPGATRGAACLIGHPNVPNPHLILVESTGNGDNQFDTNPINGLQMPYDIALSRLSGSSVEVQCTTEQGHMVQGFPPVLAPGPQMGLHVRGVEAVFEWLMVVERPNMP